MYRKIFGRFFVLSVEALNCTIAILDIGVITLIKIKEIRVDGGMIKNNNFIQSLSNVTQTNIIKPENIETTSLGAAYLAGLQAGILKNTLQIEKLWKANKIFRPRIGKNEIKEQIRKWRKTVTLLINLDSSKN